MKRFTRALLSTAALALAAAQPVQAMDVSGTKIEDTATVAGKNLVLNGAGIRYKVVKVYVVGLYLTEKKGDTASVLAAPGPKRFKIVALRELSSDEFGQALLTGINKNLDKDEKTKFVNQFVKLGELFTEIDAVRKGDIITGDFNPATGTTFAINGKQVGSVLPDPAFYSAILRIWLGSSPADPTLKPLLLGEKPDA